MRPESQMELRSFTWLILLENEMYFRSFQGIETKSHTEMVFALKELKRMLRVIKELDFFVTVGSF